MRLPRSHATTRPGARGRLAGALGVAVSATVLLVAPAVAAAPSTLLWKETANDGKTPVMSFTVTSLTFAGGGWTARVSFGNLSKKTIQVGNDFGVAFFETATATDPAHAAAFAVATSVTPARPVSLKPGASWSGLVGGPGQLAANRPRLYARLVFGPLSGVPGQSSAIDWVTNHSLPIAPAGSGRLTPTGPEVTA
jgi:hypothetical protein